MVSIPIIQRNGRVENEASEGWGVRGGVGGVGEVGPGAHSMLARAASTPRGSPSPKKEEV